MLPIDIKGEIEKLIWGALLVPVMFNDCPIPLTERNTNSSLPAGVSPLFLTKANHAPSFFTKYVLSIKPLVSMSDFKVAAQEELDSKLMVLNYLLSIGFSFNTLLIVVLY